MLKTFIGWLTNSYVTILAAIFSAGSIAACLYATLNPTDSRRWTLVAAVLAAAAIIAGAKSVMFPANQTSDDSSRYSIVFNVVIFLTTGMAALISATPDWPSAIFWAAATLLLGGVTGFIATLKVPKTDSTTKKPNALTAISEAAGSLKTLVAGGVLASYKDLIVHFKYAAKKLGSCIKVSCCTDPAVFAAGVIGYFFLLGLIAGMLLPRYFLQPFERSDG